jgi:hypothetical protein
MGNLKANYNVGKKLPECTLFMNVRFYKKSDSEVKYIKLPVARKSIVFCLSSVS